MAVDEATVRRVARLARIAVEDDEVAHLQGEINAVLEFVDALVSGPAPHVRAMTSVRPMRLSRRPDIVTDGGDPEAVLANAPERAGDFYVVPKVVE